MSRRWRQAVVLYVVLLLVLAVAGGVNQQLSSRRARLMDQQATLTAKVSALRVEAAKVRGALAVARYAEANGMVPAPDVPTVIPVAPSPAPTYTAPQEGLEIRTIWR